MSWSFFGFVMCVLSLQGLWTDGRLAFTVALDQKLRCWQMKHHALMHRGRSDSRTQPSLTCVAEERTVEHAAATHVRDAHAAASPAADVHERDLELHNGAVAVSLWGEAVTQVLEPAALDAVYRCVDQTYHVLVAGRGTQLLSMTS